MSPLGRRALLVAIALVVIVGVVPVVLDRDSFPLSTYPMFSTRRTGTEPVDTAVASDGTRTWRLDPRTIGGTDEPVSATVTVTRAIASGTADQLCGDIARRVAEGGPSAATTVEVVTERYDAVAWYHGDREPLDRIVRASCPVER